AFAIDGNQLKVTLEDEPKDDIFVDYEKSKGNLTGTNGMDVEDFDFTYKQSFATGLEITQPGEEAVAEKRPEIAGKVTADSTVDVVIKDNDGNEVEGAGGKAEVDNDDWTF